MKKILFVCLGNICRSPSAEGVFSNLIDKNGLKGKLWCDSAGTSAHHVGEKADKRSRLHAQKRGINLTSISRQFLGEKDFLEFDLILAMDESNLENIRQLDTLKKYNHKIKLISDYAINRKEKNVPDPYYLGDEGFELVLDILEDFCLGLLEKVKI